MAKDLLLSLLSIKMVPITIFSGSLSLISLFLPGLQAIKSKEGRKKNSVSKGCFDDYVKARKILMILLGKKKVK